MPARDAVRILNIPAEGLERIEYRQHTVETARVRILNIPAEGLERWFYSLSAPASPSSESSTSRLRDWNCSK